MDRVESQPRLRTRAATLLLTLAVSRARRLAAPDVLLGPALLVGLIIGFSVSSPYFLTGANFTNVLLQASVLAIVAFGSTLVILAGELDLSVGAGVALVSVISAIVMNETGSLSLGTTVALASGGVIGIINGWVVTKLHVPSFIATLGMLVTAQGAALALTGGSVVTGVPASIAVLNNDGFLGIRFLTWIAIGVCLALHMIVQRTSFGIAVLATGGSRDAARLAGIPVDRVLFLCFVTSGLSIGIGGFTLMARVQSGQPNAGGVLALMAIAAIVLGGSNLLGGRGSVLRTAVGVLLISILQNGLDIEGINDELQQVIVGGVFIVAASLDHWREWLARAIIRHRLRRGERKVTGNGLPDQD